MPADVVAELRARIEAGKFDKKPQLKAEALRRIAKYETQQTGVGGAHQRFSPTAPSGLDALKANPLFEQAPSGQYATPGSSASGPELPPTAPAAPAPGAHTAPAASVPEHFMQTDVGSAEETETAVIQGMGLDDAESPFGDDVTEQTEAPWTKLEQDNALLDEEDLGLEVRSQIPSLSRSTNPELMRPTEFSPEGGPSFASMAGGLLPGFAGMRYRHQSIWQEPSPEEFREAVRPHTKGTMPAEWADNDLVKESEAYKRYADARWAQAYDEAVAEGRPISRISFQNEKAQMAARGMSIVDSALGGSDEALSAGLMLEGTGHLLEATGDEGAIEGLRSAREQEPVARAAGMFGGALLPFGAAGLSARAGMSAAAASGAPRVVGGALGGAAGTALQSTAQQGVRLASDEIRGKDVTMSDVGDAAAQVGMDALLGAGVGAAFDLPTAGAARYSRYVQEKSPLQYEIADLEAGGGRVRMTGGIEETPPMEALRARARGAPGRPLPREQVASEITPPLTEKFGQRRIAELREAPETAEAVRRAEGAGAQLEPTGGIKETPEAQALRSLAQQSGVAPDEFVADAIAQPLAQQGLKRAEAKLQPLAERRAAYHDETKNTYLPATEYGNAVYRALRSRLSGKRKGQPLPEVEIGRLKSAFERVFIPRTVSADDLPAAMAKGWKPVHPDVARAMGMPKVPGHTQFLEVAKLNPSELEQTLSALARRAGHKTGASPADPVDLELDLAARRVRDRFPANGHAPETLKYQMPDGTEVSGYSALNAEYSEAARSVGDELELSGLPREYSSSPKRLGESEEATEGLSARLSVPEDRAFRSRIRGYKTKPGMSKEDDALRSLADEAGRGSDLDTVVGIKATDELQGKIVTDKDIADLKTNVTKYRRAEDRTDKDLAFRALAEDAGVAGELDNLAAVNAADELRGAGKVGLGFGITPTGLYPRAGGSLGTRTSLAAYGLSNQLKKPFGMQGSEIQISERLREVLRLIRKDPKTAQAARQGVLPRASDYSPIGMAGGGKAVQNVMAARPQGPGEMSVDLSDEQVAAILQSDENTNAPVRPEEMEQITQLLEQWRRAKELRQ